MLQQYRNIYQIARDSKGITQEKAAELINISVESLRAYEYDKRIPPNKIVFKMIEIYDSQYLAFQHLKESSEIGQKYLPEIEERNISLAVLNLLKELKDVENCEDKIILLASDGIISEDEKEQWNFILKQADNLLNAIMTLKFAK